METETNVSRNDTFAHEKLVCYYLLVSSTNCDIRKCRCSTAQTGSLTKTSRAVDGIFGFGQQSLSVISQLSSQGVAPQAFSHCLRGDSNGGGILVLGEIVEPGMVYTPLVPNMYATFSYFILSVFYLLRYRLQLKLKSKSKSSI